jgi:hypothetical protein
VYVRLISGATLVASRQQVRSGTRGESRSGASKGR